MKRLWIIGLLAGALGMGTSGCLGGGGGGGGGGGSDDGAAPADQGGGGSAQPGANQAPSFTSTAPAVAEVGTGYAYDASATDPNFGDTLTYSLASAPQGMAINPQSGLIGWVPTASQAGARSVTVRVQDQRGAAANQTFEVAVDPRFAVTPSATSVQPGEVVLITLTGGLAPYGAVLAEDHSGAGLAVGQEVVTYTAGQASGTDVVDIHDARGRVETVAIFVEGDTFAHFEPAYGVSDPWRLRFDVSRGASNPYRSDYEQQLVRLGLRTDGAFGAGDTHDQLAATLVQLRILSHTAQLYLREADGSAGAEGLPISLFAHEPSVGTPPPLARSIVGTSNRFNVMEIASHNESGEGTLGRAFVDTGNPSIENNGGTVTDGAEEKALGVDIVDCTGFYAAQHGSRLLTSDPVNAADVPTLQALIAGQAPQGARAQALEALVDHYAFRMAVVIAHEIGHSVGFNHNGTSGSIMFPNVSFANGIDPQFLASEVTTLQQNLPGFGRDTAGAYAAAIASGPDVFVQNPVAEMRAGADGRLGCTCGHGLATD